MYIYRTLNNVLLAVINNVKQEIYVKWFETHATKKLQIAELLSSCLIIYNHSQHKVCSEEKCDNKSHITMFFFRNVNLIRLLSFLFHLNMSQNFHAFLLQGPDGQSSFLPLLPKRSMYKIPFLISKL